MAKAKEPAVRKPARAKQQGGLDDGQAAPPAIVTRRAGEDVIDIQRLIGCAQVRAQSFDEKSNTIDVVWTTGATVRRYDWGSGYYDEELVVDPASVRLDRLNQGAPFLNSHDCWDLNGVLGSVVAGSARLANGQGVAKIQLTRREDAAGIIQDIRDGVISNISCGYRYHKIEKIESDDGSVPLWRVVDWEPLELSAVPIPADPGAQIRGEEDRKRTSFPCVVMRNAPARPTVTIDHVLISRIRMRMRERDLGLAA